MPELTFKVRGCWSDRTVACRVALCLGITSVIWDDEGLRKGPPYWREDDKKWDLGNNNYWLRKIKEESPEEILHNFPVKTFRLGHRYATDNQIEALEALCKWLEYNLIFGA